MVETDIHHPVLLNEALAGLRVLPEGVYIDGTFGRGGHAGALLQRLGPQGRLLAMDKDPQAVRVAEQNFGTDARFSVKRGTFAMLQQMADEQGVTGRVDGVLLDLGVSSPQLDDARRGFSFSQDGPLDMRMDPDAGLSAAQWLAQASEEEIADVLKTLGEERFARRIARSIVATRVESPLTTTGQLAELIVQAVPGRERKKHPATRSFQAIRIHINRELEDIREGLAQALAVLAPGGRLVVISFHSLEDRLVKRFMRDESRGEVLPPDLPVTGSGKPGRMKLIGKAVKAGEAELAQNPRARSAVMRVAERVA